MAVATTLALRLELPALGARSRWPVFESWAVEMREQLPGQVLAQALDQLQERLIDEVCGPRWLPVRDLPAPFGCPRCGARKDFARKGRRSRPRRFRTAAGVVSLRLWHVGCRACGKVFAPLLVMLDVMGQRRTDRLSVDLAELASQMSFAKAAAVSRGFGVTASTAGAYQALADVAALLGSGGRLAGDRVDVVLLDGTLVRVGDTLRGQPCNVVLGLTGRSGPPRRRRARTVLLGATVGQDWPAMADRLRGMPAPRLAVVDGEQAITSVVQTVWPQVPIQRCWWHLASGLRWALKGDPVSTPMAKACVRELADLLRGLAIEQTSAQESLARYDDFTDAFARHGCRNAVFYLAQARNEVFTCFDETLRERLRHLGGPEVGTGLAERVMRHINERVDVGGSRWTAAGLQDVVTLLLMRCTKHPAWQALRAATHPTNPIPFSVTKFNAI